MALKYCFLHLLCPAAALTAVSGKNKGFAVNTLNNCGVLLVCADEYLVKRAIVAGLCVVCALAYRTGNRMIGLFIDFHFRCTILF